MTKKRKDPLEKLSDSMNSLPQTITGQDMFGTDIHMNYRGDDTFRTFPGGLISIFCLAVSFAYFGMKLKQMVLRENWTLVSQNILSTKQEMIQPYKREDMKNLTLSLQVVSYFKELEVSIVRETKN